MLTLLALTGSTSTLDSVSMSAAAAKSMSSSPELASLINNFKNSYLSLKIASLSRPSSAGKDNTSSTKPGSRSPIVVTLSVLSAAGAFPALETSSSLTTMAHAPPPL